MLYLTPISTEHQDLIANWFANDLAGNKELGFYKNISAWLKLLNQSQRWGWIVCDETEKIGFIDLEKDLSNTGHFSFYLAPQERGKRKSKELLLLVVNESQKKNIQTLQAGVEKNNFPSKKALESFGFVSIGIDKNSYLIYRLEVNDFLDLSASRHHQ